MIEDARYAFRQLWKNPGFTVVAVMTLALGIGAAAAMFGLIQGVLLSPPPYVEPDRLVLVSAARIDGQPYNQRPTTAQQVAWRAAASLETQALYRWTFNFLVLHDGSESLGGMIVTKDYFRVLGLKPILGRELADDEAGRPNAPPKALLLGYELWKRRFNSDPRVIGTTVRIGRFPAPLAVVGVMPPGVRFLPDPGNASEPNYDVNAHVDFWLAGVPDETRPQARGWNIVTRLRRGITRDRAQAEVAEIAARQARSDANLEGLTASVRPLLDELNQQGSRLLMPLFGAVVLLFLVACGNVTGLLLARGLQRQQEYAMRSALGARRWRLFRQVLTESTLLAVVSAFAGAGLAAALMTLLKGIAGDAVPRSDAVTVGWPVFASGFLAALLAAALAGLLPALRASLPDRFRTLEGGRSSASRGERRLLGAVATLQVVLTVALLAGAALLIRTTQNLARVRPGYDTENILAMTVTTMQQQEKWREFHAQALERVSALAGVTHTAFVWGLPLTGNKWPGEMEIIGQPGSARLAERLNLPLRAVTPEYFAAMGIGLVDGRGFRSSDDNKAPRVAVVNRTFARRYFQDANPIGRRMRFAGDTDATRSIEIVGVVADTKTEALSENAQPEVYFSFWQNGAFSKHLIVRATSDPSALASLVTRELRAIDPTAAVEQIKTMGEIRRESVASRTFAMQLLIGFSLAATLLALVGLYGVLSLSVGSRTKEMAVRKAIGAQQYTIVRLVLGEGFRLIALGAVLGVVLAVLVGRVLSALLFEVRAVDPMTLAGSAGVFAAVALIACTLPAWRAARTDLMEALRHE
jgi:putative ABC transport system permease protein